MDKIGLDLHLGKLKKYLSSEKPSSIVFCDFAKNKRNMLYECELQSS